MANLSRRQREREPGQTFRLDPFSTLRDLFRWEPFADLDMIPRTGDVIFSPDVELKETPEGLVLSVDLPGMREDEIDISIVGNRLTLSGRREERDRREGDQYFVYERQYGTFTRTFVLPDTYDPENVKAEMKDGVLTIVVPKKAGAQARHVPVMSHGREGRSREGQTAGAITGRSAEGQGAGAGSTAGRSSSEGSTTGRSSATQGERGDGGKAGSTRGT